MFHQETRPNMYVKIQKMGWTVLPTYHPIFTKYSTNVYVIPLYNLPIMYYIDRCSYCVENFLFKGTWLIFQRHTIHVIEGKTLFLFKIHLKFKQNTKLSLILFCWNVNGKFHKIGDNLWKWWNPFWRKHNFHTLVLNKTDQFLIGLKQFFQQHTISLTYNYNFQFLFCYYFKQLFPYIILSITNQNNNSMTQR